MGDPLVSNTFYGKTQAKQFNRKSENGVLKTKVKFFPHIEALMSKANQKPYLTHRINLPLLRSSSKCGNTNTISLSSTQLQKLNSDKSLNTFYTKSISNTKTTTECGSPKCETILSLTLKKPSGFKEIQTARLKQIRIGSIKLIAENTQINRFSIQSAQTARPKNQEFIKYSNNLKINPTMRQGKFGFPINYPRPQLLSATPGARPMTRYNERTRFQMLDSGREEKRKIEVKPMFLMESTEALKLGILPSSWS